MSKVPGQDSDYLDLLVRQSIDEIRRISPMAGDILQVLGNTSGPMEVRALAQRTLDAENSVDKYADVTAALNMRKGPRPDEVIVKVLAKGSRLHILENGGESRIGMPGEWLRVADETGVEGFVMAQYLARQTSEEKINSIMQTLEQFDKMELVEISRQDRPYYVSLTQRGRYVFEYMSKQNKAKG